MDDMDRLLTETMRHAADRAPSDAELLSVVRRRSDRNRRRRATVALSALAAVLALGVPSLVLLVTRPDTTGPNAAASTPSPPATGVASADPSPSTGPNPSRTPITPTKPPSSGTVPPAGAVTLIPGYQAPAFPYTLPPTNGMKAPVVSMEDGKLIAFFEATEQRYHADITVTVSSRKPAFTTSATETEVRVRGHSGRLRTVHVQPAEQLTLYWQESASRWIELATDDTYTPQQVVALAGSLSPASIDALPPFELAYSPAGLLPDSVTASTMSFRAPASPPGAAGFTTVLRERQPLPRINETVGEYGAYLAHGGGTVVLRVDVTDWDATLEVTVGGGLTMTDADLLRFAAGVRILNRSNPE